MHRPPLLGSFRPSLRSPLALLFALALISCGTPESPTGGAADTGTPLFGQDTGGGALDSGAAAQDSGAAGQDGGAGQDGAGSSGGDGAGSGGDACASEDGTCDGVDDDCDGQTDEDAATGDCDDGNACTTDACNAGKCAATPQPDGASCDDGDACTAGDTCASGACTGKAQDCDDGNPCTKDQCNPLTGKCGYALNDGAPCDDGDACTAGDVCKGTSCEPGVAKTCPPGKACEVGQCDKATGQCGVVPAPPGTGCEDGNPCTVDDTCVAGKCTPGGPKKCGIDNPCFSGTCDPQSGKCTTSPAGDGTPCNDANKCTQGDVCKAGKCEGKAVVCDDSNPCTDDACDLSVGCSSTDNSAPCDDNKPCTTKDTCAGGACQGGPAKDCDDGNPCTQDSCDKATGACQHDGAPLKDKVCSDGDKCTLTDTCDGQGKCQPGTKKTCDDAKPCTQDLCDPKTGSCSHPKTPAGKPCDDGSLCTIGDTCDAKGACSPGKAISCADNNPCTVDNCDAKTGQCTFQSFPDGASCDDGDKCTPADSCQKGKCTAGKAKDCDDGNVCTKDGCNTSTGACTKTNLNIPCDDGDACSLGENCATGTCKAPVPGTVSTLFGTGSNGSTNGAANVARVYYPQGVDTAKDGRVFLADRSNNRIRLFKPDTNPKNAGGLVSTFAGTGSSGTTNGSVTSARFYYPADVAWHEGSQTLYVADRNNHRVRKIAKGQVTTFAGGSSGKVDGKGTAARFSSPEGIAVGVDGRVYVADTYNHCIRRIAVDGTVITLSGVGSNGSTNGPGHIARFYYPRGLTVMPDGSVLVADTNNHRIRKVAADGTASTYAGTGSTGLTNGSLTQARFYYPYDIARGPGGALFVADNSNRRIRKIASGTVTVYAGSGSSGYLDGAPNVARFTSPTGLAVDVQGRVVVADYSGHRVRRLSVPMAACDDTDPCTADKCDKKTGCAFTALKAGAACSDGSACTLNDACSAGGQCVGKAKTCTDGQLCTVDSCNAATGACVFTKSTAPCDDGDACTLGETCSSGTCKPEPAGSVSTAFGTGSSSFTNGPASVARVYYPRGLDTALDGRVFLADRSNHRIRLFKPGTGGKGGSVAAGTVSTYAGSGSASFLDGTVTSARFREPADVAWHEASQTLYVADRRNYRIRKVAGGKVTTLAGGGSSALKDGKGTAAGFYYPEGIAVSAGGMVYVSDTYNHAIRRIDPDGTVVTLAGSKSTGYVNGKGSAARFYYPRGLTLQADGSLIVADSSNHRLRRVTADGTVSLYAGTGSGGLTNGSLTQARFYYPYDVARGPGGMLAVADRSNHRIRKIAGGTVSVLAGTGSAGFTNGAGNKARFYYPNGVAIDVQGRVWVGDYQNHRVRLIGVPNAACDDGNGCTADACDKTKGCVFTPKKTGTACTDGNACTLNDACSSAGQCTGKAKVCTDGNLCTDDLCDTLTGKCSFPAHSAACDDGDACTVGETCTTGACKVGDTVGTWVGNGSGGYTNGKKPTARVYYPRGMARANDGTIYLADRNNHRIRKIAPDGTISLHAGSGSLGSTNGNATSARFYYPSDVAVSTDGSTVYVADRYNHRIRKIAGGTVSTLAGASNGFKDGAGTTARFYYPEGIATDPSTGNLIVADSYNNRIRRVTPSGVVTTVAGSGSSSYKEGTGTSANFYRPFGVAVDPGGTIYVADSYNHRIRRILPSGQTQLIAGSSASFADGKGAQARFSYPSALSVRDDGKLLVADRGNHRVRLVDPATGDVSTLAGSSGGFAEGAGTKARFNNPYSVLALPKSGDKWPFLVSDYSNHRIRISGPTPPKDCDDDDTCTIDSCDPKKGCQHKAVVNCCNPVKKSWTFATLTDQSGWVFRKCAASTGYYTPKSCGSPYTANSATKGWQVWDKAPTKNKTPGALFYGQRAGPNFNFGANAGTALSPTMTVPTGTAKLEFSVFCGTESGNKYDKTYIWLWVDGKRVNVKSASSPYYGAIWYLGQSGATTNKWHNVSLNVAQYAGKKVQLEFYFNSGDSISNTGKGVYVDDIKLIGSCPK